MTKELSNKTKCVGLDGGIKVFLTENEYNELKNKLKAGADVVIISEGTPNEKIVSKYSFRYAINSGDMDINQKEKQGEWKCQYGYWHKRGEECGHAELLKYNK